jgi:hypothetical protein
VEKYSPSTSPNFHELYWYGAGNEALDETDGTGSFTNSAFHEYVMFGGRRIARRDSSGNVDYYIDDQLGSARVVTNATSPHKPAATTTNSPARNATPNRGSTILPRAMTRRSLPDSRRLTLITPGRRLATRRPGMRTPTFAIRR